MTEIKSEEMKRALSKIGAKIIFEPEYQKTGEIIFKSGKKTFFYGNDFELNLLASSEIASDKGYSKYFLKKYNYNISEGETFFSKNLNDKLKKNKRGIDEGLTYAKKLGFPVILKPNNLSQGELVSKIYNAHEYYDVAKKIFKKTDVMLVERFYAGNDYRIVVLDGKVISAYQRIPLHIIGDGKNSIKNLLIIRQNEFIKQKRDTMIDINDFRIKKNLKQKKLTFNSVISKNEKIFLLDNANLSTGGESVDFTDKIHPDYIKLAINISKEMNLTICGVDLIIAGDIRNEISNNYTILEVNDSPGLDNYSGNSEELYIKLLKILEKKC